MSTNLQQLAHRFHKFCRAVKCRVIELAAIRHNDKHIEPVWQGYGLEDRYFSIPRVVFEVQKVLDTSELARVFCHPLHHNFRPGLDTNGIEDVATLFTVNSCWRQTRDTAYRI
jgi:hypothetical protein